MTTRHQRLFTTVILTAAFLLRLAVWLPAVAVHEEGSRFARPDTPGYLAPARMLAKTGRFALTPEGAPTAIRAPGVAVAAYPVYALKGGDAALAFLFVLISTATVWLIGLAGRVWKDERTGLIAAALAALSPTAIAQAPMLLSDTLFGLFAAAGFLFFLLAWKKRQIRYFVLTVAVMAAGTLVRPIGLAWLLPGLVMLAVLPGIPWRRKAAGAALAVLVQAAILLPWMARNAAIGSGWCIDTNTGAMSHQNGAMILAAAHGTSFEAEKRGIRQALELEFQDTAKYPDEAARERRRKARFLEIIKAHPVIFLRQHFRPWSLLPDLPTLCELYGQTTPNRGTMDVLQKEGVLAAVRHYFGGGLWVSILLTLPLLAAAAVVRFAALLEWLFFLRRPRQNRVELLLFLGCAVYYLFLPGPITAPRYFLPALPAFAVYAAAWLERHFRRTGSSERKGSSWNAGSRS